MKDIIKNLILILILLLGAVSMGQDKSTYVVGIKNFNQYFESLRVVTGVDPSRNSQITTYYRDSMNRLPKDGRVEELSAPAMLTYTALAGFFCRDFVNNTPSVQRATVLGSAFPNIVFDESSASEIIKKFALLFWGRSITEGELKKLMVLAPETPAKPVVSNSGLSIPSSAPIDRNALNHFVISVCTTMATSPNFIEN